MKEAWGRVGAAVSSTQWDEDSRSVQNAAACELRKAPVTSSRIRGVSLKCLRVLLLNGAAFAWAQLAAAQQPTAPEARSARELPWGEIVDGLQLQVEYGRGTDPLVVTESLLYLLIRARNVSSTPIYIDLSEASYDFEYEIDGIWYAFRSMPPVRTPSTVWRGDVPIESRIAPIFPDSTSLASINVPLAASSETLSLYAATSDGTRFQATPGPHVVRVRPGPSLMRGRGAPVSNAVTVYLSTPVAVNAGEHSISFVSAAETGLDEFRFASGPTDGPELIRSVFARPPDSGLTAHLLSPKMIEISEPLPFYRLTLPRSAGASDPQLPALPETYHYLVSVNGQTVSSIALAPYPTGSAVNGIGSARVSLSRLEALQALAQMAAIRGGDYEPRLLNISGVRGTVPIEVVWLHSSRGLPDLFYRLPQAYFSRDTTSVELDRLYNIEELMVAVRALPVSAKYDERWATATAAVCAQGSQGTYGGSLIYDGARVEIGLNDEGDGVVWYVYFSERLPDGIMGTHSGAAFFVDEADSSCRRANLGG